MRRSYLIISGLCAAGIVAAGGGWYALHSADAMAQARTLMQQGNYRSAQLVLRNLVSKQPELAEAHLRLSLVQLRLGDAIAAEHEAREATARGADEHAVRPLLAQALASQKQAETVLRDFNDNGLNASQSSGVHIARAVAAAYLKQFDLARTEVKAAQAAEPGSPDAPLTLARIDQLAGDLPAAGQAVDQALAIDPHSNAGLELRARLLLEQGSVPAAIDAYDAVLADPSSKSANVAQDYFALANLQLIKNDDAAAMKAVTAGLKTAPRSPFGNYVLAVLSARAGKWQAADEALNAVGPALANFSRGDVLLATVKANVGQPQQALDAAEHFHTHNPKDVTGVKLLAQTDLSLGRTAAAVQVLAPWAAANPPDPSVLILLSRAYAASGQGAQAQAVLQQAASATPNDPSALSNIARVAMREGNFVLGSDMLQAALSNEQPAGAPASGSVVQVDAPTTAAGPSRADTAAALVVASLRSGQVARAAEALKNLRDAHGDPEQIDLLTGAVNLAQYDLQGARTAFERARVRNPASVQVVVDLASVMLVQGDADAASALLRDALAKQPTDMRLVNEWVRVAAARNMPADALTVVAAAHSAAPTNAGLTAMLAGLYVEAKQPDKALPLVKELPADSPLQLSLQADVQRALGNETEALASWQALLAKLPQDTVLRRRIVGFLSADGHDDMAAQILQQGLDAHPDDAGLQAEAVALAAHKDGLAAGLSRADGFAAHSSQLGTLLLKGDLLMANRKFADAAAAYAQAGSTQTGSSAQPAAEALMLHQAAATLAAGDQAGAVKLVRDWQQAHPGSDAGTEMLAEIDIGSGKLADARTKLDAVLKDQPNNAAALNNAAWIDQQNGDFTQSLTLATRAYSIARTPQAADTLGWALFNTGRPADALPLLGNAAGGQPNDPTVQYHYAVALQQAGKSQEAKAVLKPVLATTRPFKERQLAEQMMQSLGGP